MEVAHHFRATLIALVTALWLVGFSDAARGDDGAGPPWLEGYAARFELQLTGPADRPATQSAIATLPVGGLCRADAGDITVQTPDGRVLPVAVLSHAPGQHAVIQFARQAGVERYWASVGHPKAVAERMAPLPEGITLEVREWDGGALDSWPSVREGLAAKPPIDSFQVADVIQSSNPARPGDPLNFAASYRGYLNITTPGPYRFLVNSDDAAFLFVNDFLVCERPGQNMPMRGAVPLEDVGGVIELTAGVHRFEVHHAVGSRVSAYGLCALLWFPQGQTGKRRRWHPIDKEHFAAADHARVCAVQSQPNNPVAIFQYCPDDALTTQTGLKLYLVRFVAQGDPLPGDAALQWDFGDGSTGVGRSVTHVYFEAGDYDVTLRAGENSTAFHQRVHVWPAPGKTSPFSPQRVAEWFAATDWKSGDLDRVYQMFDFLLICDQDSKWSLMGEVSEFLLAQNDGDPQLRADLYAARIEALAHQGKSDESLRLADQVIPQFANLPTQRLSLQLTKARVLHRWLRDLPAAARMYQEIIEEHRRLDDPLLRMAAVRWGDVCSEAGDASEAARRYRLAQTLGGQDFQRTAVTEAIGRGAEMRIAEQSFIKGNLQHTVQLLRKLEIEQPEQKLSGLYRLLSGETARLTGHLEDALANFEAVLRMTQWSGYHDRATFGIADTYRLAGDMDRATKWITTLRTTYPTYGEKEKLDEYQALLEQMAKRQAQGGWPMQQVMDDFEPVEGKPRGLAGNYAVGSGLGLFGTNVVRMDNHAKYAGYWDYQMPAPNLVPDGWYWVELWYRESLMQAKHRNHAHIHTYLRSDAGKMHDGFANEGTTYFDRTYGQWRKFGFMHKAPSVIDGNVLLSVRYNWGDMEFDGLSIQRVTDREHAGLYNFIEGAGGEVEPTDE